MKTPLLKSASGCFEGVIHRIIRPSGLLKPPRANPRDHTRIDRHNPTGMFCRRVILAKLLVVLVTLGLVSGCSEPQIQFKDHIVHEKSPQWVPTDYLIGEGDQLEVLYHIDPNYSVAEYLIGTQDTLRIEFYYYPAMSHTVRVRPDGYITLPLVGDVFAGDKKPSVLADEISVLFRKHLNRPQVGVEVLDFDAKLQAIKQAITTQDRGQSRLVVVRPDGKISLPYVDELPAAGQTASQLGQTIETKYKNYLNQLSITVAVLQAVSNRIYLMGQVENPGYYQLPGPITLSQSIATAGGFTAGANTQQILVISRDNEGRPTGRIFDMDEIIGRGDIGADPFIKQYDVIFVPRTKLAQAAVVGDALWRFIPLRFTGAASAAYYLGGTAAE